MANDSLIGWMPTERLSILVARGRSVWLLRATRMVTPTGVDATMIRSHSVVPGRDVVPVVSSVALERDLGPGATGCAVDPGMSWTDDGGERGLSVPVWGVHLALRAPGSGISGLRRGVRRTFRRITVVEVGSQTDEEERSSLDWLLGVHPGCLTSWSLPVTSPRIVTSAPPGNTRRLATGTVPLCRDAQDEPIAV